ncbi:MAG TPA: helix-turn-helix domain-containing protein [Gordonia sp. (in: high G+C Gram-positive bacteria)]|nr:helix-turn-helix domain-containing protein [Gordonia sp. (in: high G+C Gram-positive bacteria)]HMS73891.1 helix-turn-helix domain-containing protein [Gordonia sp. (in: high G+C Gram-positive bacteria)]
MHTFDEFRTESLRIAVHAFTGITLFHLAAPLLVFGEVSRQIQDAGWSVHAWTSEDGPVTTCEGQSLGNLAGAEAADDADLLVFPSWPMAFPDPGDGLLEVITRAHRRGARIAGLCLGAFPVAAAGILDGWSATTHWAAAEFLAQRYPDVQVDADSLYIDHGDVLTSAGTASAIDASLHIVRSELGSDVATYIARFLVVAPHRDGGQAQYIHRPIVTLEASPLGDTISWALGHLDQPLTVEALAERSAMSPRNFSRRFREITGLSPARWLRMQRLDEARRLLEVTTWPIARVAAECGFLSVVTFRQNFVARYGTTPTIYRSRFSGP